MRRSAAARRRVRKEPVAAAPTRLRSWASLPQRALDVWRIEGLRSVAWRMLAATVYRRLVVLERPFPGFDAHAGRAASVTIERVGDEALGDYLRLRPDERRAAVERRFASGEHCFLAYDRGRVVGAAWVTARRTFVDYLDWEVKLAPGALCVHDLYVVPDWRGKGLDRALYAAMYAAFADGGWATLTVMASLENRTYRLFERLGLRRSGLLGCYRLGPWRRHVARLAPGQNALDI